MNQSNKNKVDPISIVKISLFIENRNDKNYLVNKKKNFPLVRLLCLDESNYKNFIIRITKQETRKPTKHFWSNTVRKILFMIDSCLP